MARLAGLAVTAFVAAAPVGVEAALVDAGELTSVSTAAALFDTSLGGDNDCEPAGCIGDLTRDGDSTSLTSRWSCKPELGPDGSTCAITYDLGSHLHIEEVHIALYKGDSRRRTIDVYVDDAKVTTWTSSGETAGFEAVELSGEVGQKVELRGVLESSEWLSILEVEILVDDSSPMEAGTLGAVEATATYYDTKLADDNGCDPAGCTASLTRDDDLDDGSRWSCATSLGGDCSISYDLGVTYDLSELLVVFYKGDERTRTLDILVDGALVRSWTSSGATAGYESIDLSGESGRVIEMLGDLPDSRTWLSIIETKIMVYPGDVVSPPSPTPTGDVPITRTTSDGRLIVEAGEVDWVVVSSRYSQLYDTRLAADGGCDPIGCVQEYTRDGSLEPNSRWSCQGYTTYNEPEENRLRCRVYYELPGALEIYAIRLALHQGDERTRTFEVAVDDVTQVSSWTSSGSTLDYETIPMPDAGIVGEEITLRAILDEEGDWVSVTEVAIDVVVDDVPFLGVSAGDRIGVTATASTGDPGALLDGSLEADSSWTCSGGSCSATFDLQEIESIVQISLAFVEDGDIASNIFDVSVAVSEDGPFTEVLQDIPSNKNRPLTRQQFKISELARFVRIEPSVLGSGSLHLAEVDVRVSENVPIRPVEDDPSLVKVGLIPLATDGFGGYDERTEEEGGCGTEGCRLFNIKDGDASTFWRCYGDPLDTEYPTRYECEADFNFMYYRKIKQVRVALADGAERPTEMRFTSGATDALSVISSGLTSGFETYDFDAYTGGMEISAVFRGVMESISVAEVEFMEEPLDGTIPLSGFRVPRTYSTVDESYLISESGFGWGDDQDVIGGRLRYNVGIYSEVTGLALKFPVGERYKFDLYVFDVVSGRYPDGFVQEGLESVDQEDYQIFPIDFVADDLVPSLIMIVMQGTVGGEDSFFLTDAVFLGTPIDNPTGVVYVGSTAIEEWSAPLYPDFVAEGSGDQRAMMEAICKVKKGAFDGVKCVGIDPDATGEVDIPMGDYFVNGNIYMYSGVYFHGFYTENDAPYTTDIYLEEDAAGATDVEAIVIFDNVFDAEMEDIWIRGTYDPDTDNSVSATPGLGSKCIEIVDCKNVTATWVDVRNCDGDAVSITNSEMINFDAGDYDDEFLPWSISNSRGVGMLIEGSDSIWLRRHTLYNNGVAGMIIRDTRNVTFEATYGSDTSGEGNVGSLDGQQPIEIIIEGSTMLKFDHMKVTSSNEPVITVSGDSSDVSFVDCVFASIESGACVIEAEDPSVVTVTDNNDELTLVGTCFEKV